PHGKRPHEITLKTPATLKRPKTVPNWPKNSSRNGLKQLDKTHHLSIFNCVGYRGIAIIVVRSMLLQVGAPTL
ncbi:hypothetical protein, partial [Corynebacterium coyleae]|uniref:hypothetical protein n=1 Tax=Corynebacterium coyleae TaxID=53374 RepID=UPI001AD9A0AE